MKEGRDESRGSQERGGRGVGGAARRRSGGMMSHYKGKEKSKWKRGATKEYSALPLDQFESQSRGDGGKGRGGSGGGGGEGLDNTY